MTADAHPFAVLDERLKRWARWRDRMTQYQETEMPLTPKQNELISDAMVDFVFDAMRSALPDANSEETTRKALDILPDVRRVMVRELALVTAETDLQPASTAPSICG